MAVTPNAAPTGYNSAYTGHQIDAAVGAVIDNEIAWDEAAAGKLPAGGEVGQILEKTGVEDNAAEWRTPPFLVRPNLLVNWYFIGGGSQKGDGVFPINQGEDTDYLNVGEYTIDRWKRSGSYDAAVSLGDGGMALTAPSSGDAILVQEIDAGLTDCLKGQKVTLSVKFSGQTGGLVIAVLMDSRTGENLGVRAEASATEGVISAAGTLPGDLPNGISCRIYKRGAGTAIIEAVKLELGDTQTLAHQEGDDWVLNELPNWYEQLTLCNLADNKKIVFDTITTGAVIPGNGTGFTIVSSQLQRVGNIVFLNAILTATAQFTNDTIIFSLPEGFKPSAPWYIRTPDSADLVDVNFTIATNGNVTLSRSPSGKALTSRLFISFPAI